MNNLYHRRLPDWEQYDEIRIGIVPRYKTSEMSGDEWRQSAVIEFWFKGQLVKHFATSNMKTAILFLGSFWMSDDAIPDKILELEKDCCDQSSCRNKAVARFQLKRLTADDGEWLDMKDQYGTYYRQFCQEHLMRGDCGREDADDNYIPLDEKTPKDSSNTKTSPSQFGGIIEITEIGDN